MENRRGKWGLSTVMVWLVVVSSVMTTAESTSFQECYATCFVICAITPGASFSECPLKCLQACIIPSFPIDDAAATATAADRRTHNHFFCKLGCAATLCTNFTTNHNPAEKKVGRCVDSCSRTCSMD
ncbi:thionin-like protein 2 [Momordica charantia]|uniref:Thionin-like protein 2 n=1 Tax=Momordica charantia TaxID=3673 RepID=A0A6J1CW29_MOMCH|nr:thionin-like protein 2 [Momordica charantia]